jgi:hypothetical protein
MEGVDQEDCAALIKGAGDPDGEGAADQQINQVCDYDDVVALGLHLLSSLDTVLNAFNTTVGPPDVAVKSYFERVHITRNTWLITVQTSRDRREDSSGYRPSVL